MSYTTEPQAIIWRPFCIILMACFLLGVFFNTLPLQSDLVKGLLKHDLCEAVEFAAEGDCSSSSSSSNSLKDSETTEDYHLDNLFVWQLSICEDFKLSHQTMVVSIPQFPHLSLNAPPPELFSF
ncbi:MAG: hypothetical protein ACRCUJ_05500 [Phocaeicola sp.]